MDCTDARVINQRCDYYAGQGLCKLPKRVFCAEYTGENVKRKITSISASGVDNYRSCHTKWLLDSFKGISSPGIGKAFAFGRVGHMALAEYYKDGNVNLKLVGPVLNTYKINNTDQHSTNVMAINLAVLLENYFLFYPQGEFPNADVEVPIPLENTNFEDINLRGYGLHGFVDMWLPDSTTIVEHKFLDTTELKPLNYKVQKIIYLAATGASQIIINILRKPLTRPKRNETLDNYRQRVDEDIKGNPTKFFNRIPVNRDEYDMPIELNKLANLMDEINMKIASESFDENTQNCRFIPCGYESICETGCVDETFTKRVIDPNRSLSSTLEEE